MASKASEDLIAWARQQIQADGYPADDLTDGEVAQVVRRVIGVPRHFYWNHYAIQVRPLSPGPIAGEDLDAGDLVLRLGDGMYYRARGRPPG